MKVQLEELSGGEERVREMCDAEAKELDREGGGRRTSGGGGEPNNNGGEPRKVQLIQISRPSVETRPARPGKAGREEKSFTGSLRGEKDKRKNMPRLIS